MTWKEAFLPKFHDIHDMVIPMYLKNFTENQIRKSPSHGNPIIWQIWHILRGQDIGLSSFVLEEEEIYEKEQWYAKMKTPRAVVGTGMTYTEVQELSDNIDYSALVQYKERVRQNTLDRIEDLSDDYLSKKPAWSTVEDIVIRMTGNNALWVLKYYDGRNRLWFLMQLLIMHVHYHFGQISIIKKSL
ncbi:MAG: DinB family protein [Cyclobacteriaceae bacterium]